MGWIDAERARLYGGGLATIWVAWVALIVNSMHSGIDAHGHLFGGDFTSFWAAGRLVLTGWPADAYVPEIHYLAELPAGSQDVEAFYYPPPFLLLCAPLALLGFKPALILFLAVTAALYLITIDRILGSRWGIIVALTTPAIVLNVVAGQNAFLTAAILGAGLSNMHRRPRLSGAILACMVIKPHLAVMVPVALMIWRRWETLIWAGATALCLIVLSTALLGWEVWPAFLRHGQEARNTLEAGTVGFTKVQSVFSLARALGAPLAVSYAVHTAVAVAAAIGLAWSRRKGVPPALERSLIVVACLLSTPFVLQYDLVILALPLAWMLRYWIDTGFPPWSKLVSMLVLLAPASFIVAGPICYAPPALLLLGGYLLWSSWRVRDCPSGARDAASA